MTTYKRFFSARSVTELFCANDFSSHFLFFPSFYTKLEMKQHINKSPLVYILISSNNIKDKRVRVVRMSKIRFNGSIYFFKKAPQTILDHLSQQHSWWQLFTVRKQKRIFGGNVNYTHAFAGNVPGRHNGFFYLMCATYLYYYKKQYCWC